MAWLAQTRSPSGRGETVLQLVALNRYLVVRFCDTVLIQPQPIGFAGGGGGGGGFARRDHAAIGINRPASIANINQAIPT